MDCQIRRRVLSIQHSKRERSSGLSDTNGLIGDAGYVRWRVATRNKRTENGNVVEANISVDRAICAVGNGYVVVGARADCRLLKFADNAKGEVEVIVDGRNVGKAIRLGFVIGGWRG